MTEDKKQEIKSFSTMCIILGGASLLVGVIIMSSVVAIGGMILLGIGANLKTKLKKY